LAGIILLFWINELLVRNFGVVVKNSGVSFGLNAGGVLLVVIILVIFGWRVVWRGGEEWLLVVWLGGLLNFIDRMRFGFVRDYWYLGFGLYNNLADWVITLGVGMFIINLWMKKSK
jgi:lipoprotein signal peptidase